MPDRFLVDTSFLYTLFDQSDKNHATATKSVSADDILMIPEVTLTEVAFLFRRRGGVPAVADFINNFMNADPYIVGL